MRNIPLLAKEGWPRDQRKMTRSFVCPRRRGGRFTQMFRNAGFVLLARDYVVTRTTLFLSELQAFDYLSGYHVDIANGDELDTLQRVDNEIGDEAELVIKG